MVLLRRQRRVSRRDGLVGDLADVLGLDQAAGEPRIARVLHVLEHAAPVRQLALHHQDLVLEARGRRRARGPTVAELRDQVRHPAADHRLVLADLREGLVRPGERRVRVRPLDPGDGLGDLIPGLADLAGEAVVALDHLDRATVR